MAVDTPAMIVVFGADAIGLETALYGRFLGYAVTLIDTRPVAADSIARQNAPMPESFGRQATPLGLAALEAQDRWFAPDDLQAVWTWRRFADEYLLPLAESDLLSDSIRVGTRLLGTRQIAPFYVASLFETDDDVDDDADTTDDLASPDTTDEAIPACYEIELEEGSPSNRRTLAAHILIDTRTVDNPPLEPELWPEPGEPFELPSIAGVQMPAPHCYRLDAAEGDASLGQGQRQIRDLFARIADRETLDIYAMMRSSQG